MNRLNVKFGRSCNPIPQEAIEEIYQQVLQAQMTCLILFCSPTYDLEILGAEIKRKFDCPVFACTTAGEILYTDGYIQNSIVCASLYSTELHLRVHHINSLTDFVKDFDSMPSKYLANVPRKEKSFALLFIDGLSMLEERIVAKLHSAIHGIPLVGGSAADGFNFGHTRIYHDGRFVENAAVLACFETELPFKLFKIQHFEATEDKLVITDADASTRTVMEINGLPAAEEYARIIGVDPAHLNPHVFATYPVMLKIGGEYYVRSIQKMNPDGSLSFYCAIDTGLVLTVAKSTHLLENLQSRLEELKADIPDIKLILGFDCILRQCEITQCGGLDQVKELLAPYHFIGFSTYGEQFNAIHVNHTLTGLALGE